MSGGMEDMYKKKQKLDIGSITFNDKTIHLEDKKMLRILSDLIGIQGNLLELVQQINQLIEEVHDEISE